MLSNLPPVILSLSGSMATSIGAATPAANQTVIVNAAGTAWALRQPAILDVAGTFTARQTFSGGADMGTSYATGFRASVGNSPAWYGNGGLGSMRLEDSTGKGYDFTATALEAIVGFGRFRLNVAIGASFFPIYSFAGDTNTGVGCDEADGVSFCIGGRPIFVCKSGEISYREDSTTALRVQGGVTPTWVTSTDASRKARLVYNVYDTAAREWMRAEASGTAALVGFLGATAVARQSIGAAATDAATTQTLANNIRTALINLGLCAT